MLLYLLVYELDLLEMLLSKLELDYYLLVYELDSLVMRLFQLVVLLVKEYFVLEMHFDLLVYG